MKTTKEQFELFKKECQYWLDKLKLDDWEVHYYHENPVSKNADCSMTKNIIYRRADIRFSIDQFGKDNLNDKYIKSVAKHEVLHILLGTITSLAWSRFLREEELTEAEEELIRKLEKIIQ